MTTESCSGCGESIEPGYSICWRCGTHLDGTPPAADFAPGDASAVSPDAPAKRALSCLRCATPMVAVGRMRLHEGTRAWPFLFGGIGELFVNRETFDTYACERCGKVEFFVTE